jgi:hypothetical protein
VSVLVGSAAWAAHAAGAPREGPTVTSSWAIPAIVIVLLVIFVIRRPGGCDAPGVRTRSLPTIETYHDAAPRPVATTEEVGPFTLFVRTDLAGWRCCSRPGDAAPVERVGLVRVGTACIAGPS